MLNTHVNHLLDFRRGICALLKGVHAHIQTLLNVLDGLLQLGLEIEIQEGHIH